MPGNLGFLSRLVGRGGLEPPTSRLSGVRSNHLSYRPNSVQGRRIKRTLDRAHSRHCFAAMAFCDLKRSTGAFAFGGAEVRLEEI